MSRSCGSSCGRPIVRAGGRETFAVRHYSYDMWGDSGSGKHNMMIAKHPRKCLGIAGNSCRPSERPVRKGYAPVTYSQPLLVCGPDGIRKL